MHNYGNLIRLLMFNNNKNVYTRKQDLKERYKMSTKDIQELIDYTKTNIKDLGLELVGIDKTRVVDPMTSDKYCIRRLVKGEYKQDAKTYIVYTLILLEEGLSFNKLVHLCKKIRVFDEDDVENYLRYLKKDNHINIFKVDDEYIVELGWKYYVDMGHINILDMYSG